MIKSVLMVTAGAVFGVVLSLIVLAQRDEIASLSTASAPERSAPMPSPAISASPPAVDVAEDGKSVTSRTHSAAESRALPGSEDQVGGEGGTRRDARALSRPEPDTTVTRQQPVIDAPPIPIPEALRRMLDDAPDPEKTRMTMPQAHRALQAQVKDPNWAYHLEQYFRQFFANHPYGVNFDIWLIECRTTMCELQGAGYAPDAGDQLTQILEQLKAQPWMIEFTGTWGASSGEDGILYFAYIFQRDAPR